MPMGHSSTRIHTDAMLKDQAVLFRTSSDSGRRELTRRNIPFGKLWSTSEMRHSRRFDGAPINSERMTGSRWKSSRMLCAKTRSRSYYQ
jgi:hypothetical protein